MSEHHLLHFQGFTALKYDMPEKPLCTFEKRVVIVGGGSICAAFLPVFEKLVQFDWKQVTIVDTLPVRNQYQEHAAKGVQFAIEEITQKNYVQVLSKYLRSGDILIDLAYNLRTLDLLEFCIQRNVMFFNTGMYEWATVDHTGNFADAVNEAGCFFLNATFAQMQAVRELNAKYRQASATAVLCHGANPGFVSHLMKQGLQDIVYQMKHDFYDDPIIPELTSYAKEENYSKLAQLLGVKVIQISEFDSQRTGFKKERDTFISSWNVPSFCEESAALSAFPWGTHEKEVPSDARFHEWRGMKYIQMGSRSMNTFTISWAPGVGNFYGSTPHHEETVTIADFLTVRTGEDVVEYAPTVWFCYRPMDLACESLIEFENNNYSIQTKRLIPHGEIFDGGDNLGLLITGHRYKGWWIGSLLNIRETNAIKAKGVNATTMQVGASLAAAVCWAIKNPNRGTHFPETLPTSEVLTFMKPWLGPWVSMPVDWTPRGEQVPTETTWDFMSYMNVSKNPSSMFERPINNRANSKSKA